MELTRVAARQRGSLAALPDDVLDDVLLPMLDDHKDLCGLARVSQHFKKLSVSACIHMARRRGCVVVPCRHDAALHAARSPYHTIVDRRGHGTPPPVPQCGESHWQALWAKSWGAPMALHLEACKLAGSWRQLFQSKLLSDRSGDGWRGPCSYEKTAIVNRIAAPAVLYLVDGSGSVSEGERPSAQIDVCGMSATLCDSPTQARWPGVKYVSAASGCSAGAAAAAGLHRTQLPRHQIPRACADEFECCTSFIDTAVRQLSSPEHPERQVRRLLTCGKRGNPAPPVSSARLCVGVLPPLLTPVESTCHAQFAVLQFSNEVRVEMPLGSGDPQALTAVLKAMVRAPPCSLLRCWRPQRARGLAHCHPSRRPATRPDRLQTARTPMSPPPHPTPHPTPAPLPRPQVRMNGGTNIAAAIKRAAALLKAGAPRAASRSLVLLTDGRVDGYQVRAPAPGPRLQPPGAAALL
jgi:hypothetical protein